MLVFKHIFASCALLLPTVALAASEPVLALSLEGRWDGRTKLVVSESYRVELTSSLGTKTTQQLSKTDVDDILATSSEDLAILRSSKKVPEKAPCSKSRFEVRHDSYQFESVFCSGHDSSSRREMAAA